MAAADAEKKLQNRVLHRLVDDSDIPMMMSSICVARFSAITGFGLT